MPRCVGIDVGTGFLTSAEKSLETPDKIVFRKVRDCFLKVDPAEFLGGANPLFGEKMLKKTGAHFIKVNDTLYILGDSAHKMAGITHKETLRPMSKGVLNPNEPESAVMLAELLKAVVGKAEKDDDILFYCVPANPLDADFDVEYHKSTLSDIFKSLGYKNINVMNEGLAVIFSEAQKEDFTALSFSLGAGMVNMCYSFMGMPILSCSISKSGDWIDSSSAKHLNETMNAITIQKERGMSLLTPKNDTEKAIAVYYRTLLKYLVAQIKNLYLKTDKKTLPNLYEPIPLIVAGGTSLVGDFIPVLKQIIDEEKNFPIPIREIKLAEEPIYSVSHGLYNAARLQAE